MAIYSVCGGIPAYLELFTGTKSFKIALRDHCLLPGSLMLTDPALLLYEQLREPQKYGSVLWAIASGQLSSFPYLSLGRVHRRQWHSLHKAGEQGSLDEAWLSSSLPHQVPRTGVQYFSLGGTAWPRPWARTLDDRQYVLHLTAAVNGGSVCIGYPCSLLDWVPEAPPSWSLSLNVARIPSHSSAREIGLAQIQAGPYKRSPGRRDCAGSYSSRAARPCGTGMPGIRADR